MLLALLLGATSALADPIEPNLAGAPLRAALRARFSVRDALDYRRAREQLFGRVDNDAGKVRLHYAGETIQTNTIPETSVANTEHTWPQSKFKSAQNKERLKCDLHHLFATFETVNNARGSLPFADIPDGDTTKWWRTRTFQRQRPSSDIDEFSESTSSRFEPREREKGNVSRAMLYFYTIYETNNIDLGWFQPQRETLLKWHRDDPADAVEQERSRRVAAAQGNENPFVLDATLAERIFAPDTTGPGPGTTTLDPTTAPSGVLDGVAFELVISPDVMFAHFIDVGQGNATLLEFNCGAILIDAGGQNDVTTAALLDYLREFFDRRTDLNDTLRSVIITHNHVDHTRSLREVVESFNVERVIENGQRGGDRDQGDTDVKWVVEQARSGARSIRVIDVSDSQIAGTSGFSDADIDPVNCDGADPLLTIVSADLAEDPGWGGDEFGDKNNHSVVIRLRFGNSSFLFTGDLEEPAIETMVDFYGETGALDVDVYHVGHHGSHNGSTPTLLDKMSPSIAVISMSDSRDHSPWTAWQYGHPREPTIELLVREVTGLRTPKSVSVADGVRNFHSESMNRAIFATGWDGTIVIRAPSDGVMQVQTRD